MSYITTCLATSSGDIVSALGGGGISQLTNLSNAFTNINNFSGTGQAASLTSFLNDAIDGIAGYGIGRYTDLPDTASKDILNNIANRSIYGGCANALFPLDSWVPNTMSNQTTVPCTISGGNTGTTTPCSGNFASGAGTCNGCMDTYELFYNNASGAAVATSLATRYGAVGACGTFNSDLGNVWTNYYTVLKTMIGAPIAAGSGNAAAGTGVYARAKTAQTSTTTLIGYVNTNITTLFSNTMTSVTSLTSILDPTYGVIAGLNCRLFGEDFNRILNTMCVSMFNAMYISRLTIGIASWGILFSLCCIVCSGVRHYKHSERKDKVKDAFFKNSFDQGTKQTLKGDY